MSLPDSTYEYRFEEKTHEIIGHCPHCDEEVLDNQCHVFHEDGQVFHEDCYENMKDILAVMKIIES